jgi:very-short-patch-repair endonuclease
MERHADERIASIAASQFGLATTNQLHAAGLSERQIERRVDSGHLERLHRGVVAVRGGEATWRRDLLAACLAAGPDAVASHRAAARLFAVDLRAAVPAEITVVRARSLKLDRVVIHRSRDLVPRHVSIRDAIPATKPHRILVDLGAVVPWWLVSRALEQLIAARHVTPSSVRSFLDEISRQGRDGAGILRRVLDNRALGDEPSDSGLEEVMARLASDHALPTPVFQYAIQLPGGWRSIDFAYPQAERRIAIEVDGFEVHTRYDVFQRDRVRGNELELAGWMVLHFSRDQVLHRPTYVARTIRDALHAKDFGKP